MATLPPVPKAILYYNPHSVWSSAGMYVFLIEEKGYGIDELELKTVDLKSGENFAPAYLRINPHGTVPTLVVPLEKTLGTGIPNKYRALSDTKLILEFLDKSRSAASRTHTTSLAPAPALAPATISLAEIYNKIISLLHSSSIDFINTEAVTPEELAAKARGPRAAYIKERQAALEKYRMSQEGQDAPDIFKRVWEKHLAENSFIIRVYEAADKPSSELNALQLEEREAFFRRSIQVWTTVNDILARVEAEMVGPYVLGDQLALVDLHLGAWLSRLFYVSAAEPEALGDTMKSAFSNLEKMQGHTDDRALNLGPKIRDFWHTLKQRDSWHKVYDELH
ncbi:hypothetical protein BU17DRAFT_41979 [Hysterangium stoloniferum]|nr:hypothetical protein BU17DRAFT_41979 [Hysterangium stoloniferum]